MDFLIIILVVLIAIYLAFLFVVRSMGKKWSVADRKFFQENWARIMSFSDQKHAVMEADKLLDVVLKKRGYQGSLGEKLKRHGKVFSDLNALWAAHKLRNRLAHELNFRLSEAEAKQAMRTFRKAFEDLGLFK
jgi:5'-deoxynucleotidase YfbR-like HD superfamily hydrolase